MEHFKQILIKYLNKHFKSIILPVYVCVLRHAFSSLRQGILSRENNNSE